MDSMVLQAASSSLFMVPTQVSPMLMDLLSICFLLLLLLLVQPSFLWFNIPPAQLYMGDTGAFSLGATLSRAMLTNTVLVLPFLSAVLF